MYKGEIPFNRNGDALDYPRVEYEWEYGGTRYKSWRELKEKFGDQVASQAKRIDINPVWRQNAVFEANLRIESLLRGGSTAHFRVKNMQTGAIYTMFLTDFLNLVQKNIIDRGETPRLRWCFTKRGTRFGIVIAE